MGHHNHDDHCVSDDVCSADNHDRGATDIDKHAIIDLATAVDNIVNGSGNRLIARDDCHAKHVYTEYIALYYCPDCDIFDLLNDGPDDDGRGRTHPAGEPDE